MSRIDPGVQAAELESLAGFVDYHRATFVQKVAGLDHEQMQRRVGASDLSLAALTKHLAFVEDVWVQERFLGRALPEPWASAPFDDDPDWELHSAAHHEPGELIEMYVAACERSREGLAHIASADELSVQIDHLSGERFTLRWMLLHLLEETARHNGHADLLREAIDGSVGE